MNQGEKSVLESYIGGCMPVVGERPSSIHPTEQVSSTEIEGMQGNPLTERQRQVLEVIRRSLRERGFAPSHVEIAQALGLGGSSAVEGHLKALAKKGWIEIAKSVDRGIRLLREGMPILDAEHLPAVAAGTPSVIEECRDLPRLNDLESILGEFEARPDYWVRVQGDSLDKIGFASGDIVAIHRQPEARDGDVVLARIADEVTLKRYQRIDADTVELQPVSSNPEHEAIRIGPTTDDAEIVGIVVGAIVGTRRASD